MTWNAAQAEEWKYSSVEGSVDAFASGAWTRPGLGETPPSGALLRTGADGRLLIRRGDDALSVAPSSKVDIEGGSDTLVRVYEGTLGAAERSETGKRFLVTTTQASFAADGADFGVQADAQGTTLTVRRGRVAATDIMTRRTVEVLAGQVFRATPGKAGALQSAGKAGAPMPAAKAAAEAGRAEAAADGASGGAGVDPHATGSLPGGRQKGDPKLAEDAADAVHDERRKARLGKADPREVAAAQRIASEMWQDADVETEPWSDDFKWTEVENGEVRLKPIWRIVMALSGSESFEFWTVATLICLMLGGMTNALLKEAGFGAVLNAAIVMTAFAAAILFRDAFLRAGANVSMEPFLSVGMMLGAMPMLLLAGAFAKLRLDL